MEQASPPVVDPAILKDNLSALARTAPLLADGLSQAARTLQDRAQPARARDGRPTFQLRDSDGRLTWFGRTSVPSVRGEALLERFDAGAANVLLPGIGQGYEVTRLLERLGAHRAVFVWEPDKDAILLALTLHPWAEAIDRERLVLLACPEDALERTLADWLAAHPGHLCPERIMMWPWSTPPVLAACRAAVQQAFTQTHQDRERQLADVTAKLRGDGRQPLAPPAELSTWAVVALHAKPEYWALAETMTQAMRALGITAFDVSLRGPADMHPLTRAQRIAANPGRPPDAAILLDITRNDVPELLDEKTCVVSWFSPAARIDASIADRVGQRDLIVATSTLVRDDLAAASVPADRITILPWPCLIHTDPEDQAAAGPDDPATERPIDALVLADLANTAPEAYGCTLLTQTRIWNAACDLIRARVDTFTADQTEDVLASAERQAGARIDDAPTRAAILAALGTSVANALMWPSLVQAIRDAGIEVAVYGQGWPDSAGGVVSAIPQSLEQRLALLRHAKVLIHVHVEGAKRRENGAWRRLAYTWRRLADTQIHLAMLAAATGTVVLARSHAANANPGSLVTMLQPGKEIAVFTGKRELVSVLQSLLRQTDDRLKLAVAARRRCDSEHTAAHRCHDLKNVVSSFVGQCAGQT